MLYINGNEGYGVLEPDDAFIDEIRKEKSRQDEQQSIFAALAKEPAVTADGHTVSVCINSGDADSCRNFDAEKCDGIGLFRTEFLFMSDVCTPFTPVKPTKEELKELILEVYYGEKGHTA